MEETRTRRWRDIEREISEQKKEISRLVTEQKKLGDELIECASCEEPWGVVRYPRPLEQLALAG